ncbi:unnamed protein product [Effrenium voratum]|nr:unnamed protein product [Effrenium voratum]
MAELQEQRTKNSIQLLYALGWIVPWTLIASIGNGLLVPLSQFVGLNFFAQRYTDLPPSEIHCELGVGPQYCQMALVDGNRFVTALSVLMPVCQFLTLPLVGVLSDAYGRKRALIIVYALANFALLFADLFLFFNVSFWFAMAVQPFMNAQVVTTVLNSSCVDILDKQDRAAGMGLITALDTVAYVTGTDFCRHAISW